MTRYKINRNKPEPGEEQINKHKDFQNILNNQQKILKYKDGTKPLFKNKGFMGFIILVSILLLVFVITENENKQTKTTNDTTTTKTIANKDTSNNELPNSNIVAPFTTTIVNDTIQRSYKTPKKPFQVFSVDPAKGTIIYTGSTRILIPPHAFKDSKGKLIEDNIEVRFREFLDPVDIFLSGIPMHNDSSGSQLISAGMFEIRGSAKGMPVSIAEPLTIEIMTTDHKNYNHYHFNEKTKNWEYISKEKKSVRFVFQANEKDFPEMNSFKDLIWESEVTDQQSMDDFKLIFSKTWSKFFLDEKQKPSTSNITLKKNSSEPKFLAVPIALSSDQELNKKIIQAKYTEYYEALKKKLKDEKLLEKSRLHQQEWLESEEGKAYLKWSKSEDGKRSILSSKVISIFTVNKFGIWNCDTPEKLPQEARVVPSYTEKNGKSLNLPLVILVDYNKNSVYRFYPGHLLQFNPKSENILWSVLPQGKLAVFTKEKFKKLSSSGKAAIQMDIIDINGKSENDIKSILGMNNHITSKQKDIDNNKLRTYERIIVMKKDTDRNFYESEGTLINSNGQLK